MYELHEYTDVAAFRSAARAYLLRDEVVHNLMLGIAESASQYSATPWFATVSEGGALELAALMTPPWRMMLSDGAAVAAEFLGKEMAGRKMSLPGVCGPKAVATAFARRYAETGAEVKLLRTDRLYRLQEVRPPPPVRGAMRVAVREDRAMLVEWMIGFSADIGEPEQARDFIASFTEKNIDAGAYVIWEDGKPVSAAMAGRRTEHGVAIGRVYTPPEYRRRGYATALTAELSQRLLGEGRRWCCLFADAGNATTNRIYPSIGYRFVADFEHYAIDRGKGEA